MMRRSIALALLLAFGAVTPGFAAPADSKVGDTRLTFSKKGTVLRTAAAKTADAVASLPANTRVLVDEVALPWLRVHTTGQPPQSGWLQAWETVEPDALGANAQPAHVTSSGGTGTSARDVATVGRQLDAATERGFRANRRELEAAYVHVDAMENATAALDPAEVIEFIADAGLGRRGRDYARPPFLPHVHQPEPSGSGAADAVEKGADILERFGKIKVPSAAKKLGKVAAKLKDRADQLNRKFTPENEYYLGRAVAANAIAKFGLDPDPVRRRYVRLVGDAVVRLSSMLPSTWGGYHFEVLNTDEVNAISGPGGFVLVTRGAVKACRNESELAGILAHELAHIRAGHGEALLRSSKRFSGMMGALTAGLVGALTDIDDNEVGRRLVDFMSGAVDEMTSTSIGHGYGRNFEFAADSDGTIQLWDVYYDHGALRDYLLRLATTPGHDGGATHAPPDVRANALAGVIAKYGAVEIHPGLVKIRQERFEQFALQAR
jgi:hypothetical protein